MDGRRQGTESRPLGGDAGELAEGCGRRSYRDVFTAGLLQQYRPLVMLVSLVILIFQIRFQFLYFLLQAFEELHSQHQCHRLFDFCTTIKRLGKV